MGALSALSLTIGTGILVLGASLWNDRAAAPGPGPAGIRDSRLHAPWLAYGRPESTAAAALAAQKNLPVIAWIGTRDWQPPELLEAVHGRFLTLVIRLDGSREERNLAEELGLRIAPLCVVLKASKKAGQDEVSFSLVDGLETTTGALHEPFGLSLQVMLYGTERWTPVEDLVPGADGAGSPFHDQGPTARRLRAMGRHGLADELEAEAAARAQGAASGSARTAAAEWVRVEEAWRQFGGALDPRAEPGAPPMDQEGPVEAALALTDHGQVLFRGWSALATRFARCAERAAKSPDGTFRGVPRERWERRLRDATRKGWIGCPEALVPAYGALLAERYGRMPGDLDSLDKAFLGAVVRSMAREIEGQPDLAPWLQSARHVLESLR